MSNMTALGNVNATPALIIIDNSSQFQLENNTSTNRSEETLSQLMNTSMANITETSRGPDLTSILQFKIAHWLWLYFAPVLIFGGGLSNIFAIIVLRNRRFRGTGTTFLLTALAVADLTVLMSGVLRQWILHLTNYDTNVRELTDAGCRIYLFIIYFGRQWSAWILVLLTAERAVSVWLPIKAKVICSRKRIVIAWLLASLAIAVVNIPLVVKDVFYVYSQPGNTTIVECHTSLFSRDGVAYWTDVIMFNVGPTIFICFFNMFIVVKLCRPQIDRQNHKNAKKAITSVTIMLFVVSVIFLVTTTPVAVYFLAREIFFEDVGLFEQEDVYVLADQLLVHAVCYLASYINNAINFLLYFLSGRRFRTAMTNMICGRYIKQKPHGLFS